MAAKHAYAQTSRGFPRFINVNKKERKKIIQLWSTKGNKSTPVSFVVKMAVSLCLAAKLGKHQQMRRIHIGWDIHTEEQQNLAGPREPCKLYIKWQVLCQKLNLKRIQRNRFGFVSPLTPSLSKQLVCGRIRVWQPPCQLSPQQQNRIWKPH